MDASRERTYKGIRWVAVTKRAVYGLCSGIRSAYGARTARVRRVYDAHKGRPRGAYGAYIW